MGKNKITTIDIFAEEVSNAITERLDNVKCQVIKVTKNNGVKYVGVSVRQGESNVSPTVYLEGFYNEYNKGREFDSILNQLIDMCNDQVPFDCSTVDFFNDWEKVKSKIVMKLVNKDSNDEFLSDKPHYNFGDLAVFFQVQVDCSSEGNAVITINNDHLRRWAREAKDLYEAALLNCGNLVIKTLVDTVMDLCGEDLSYEQDEADQILVMTNKSGYNGAITMLYKENFMN